MQLSILLVLCLVAPAFLQQCDPSTCVLPNCRCYNDPKVPGDIALPDVPQIVIVSFDGTVNDESIIYYRKLFDNLNNPNGCPARGTFFIQDQGTSYGLVKALYDEGHEIGIQSVDGTTPTDTDSWINMIKKVKSSLSDVAVKGIEGLRVPGIACGGDEQFIAMGNQKLRYDSSCSNVGFSNASSFIWPYTADYTPVASCDNGKAPSLQFKGKWEFIVADLHDLTGQKLPCVVPSACRNVTTKRDAFDLFFTAFVERYNGLRTPFNMIVDPAFAKNTDLSDGTFEFLQYISGAFSDVWIVPMGRALDWIREPTANITEFQPWQCSSVLETVNLDY